MDQDDDVEHLFSWLQTPELRYREFAGAREITDTVITWQKRPNPSQAAIAPSDAGEPEDEYFPDELSDQPEDSSDPRPEDGADTTDNTAWAAGAAWVSSTAAAPTRAQPTAFEEPVEPARPFALGAAGRTNSRRPYYEEPVVPAPVAQTPPEQVARPAAVSAAPPVSTFVSPKPAAAPAISPFLSPKPAAAPSAGGLLGGAYRANGSNGHGGENGGASRSPASAEGRARREQSLDAVFGRLSGVRTAIPNQPEKGLRHLPGFGPSSHRPR